MNRMNTVRSAALLKHCSSLRKCYAKSFTTIPTLQLEQLSHRQIIQVSGKESSDFLQGLITNDINHLTRGNISIYTMFLNKGGRVMYDSIIYKTNDTEKFYLECDNTLADQIVKHLKLYRIRRKIDVLKLESKKVWVAFIDDTEIKSNVIMVPKQHVEEDIICIDPRLKHLGTRLVLSAEQDESNIKEIFQHLGSNLEKSDTFQSHRYRLGIGEGCEDLLFSKSFPLESNADFLHGVSFNKGCYIGQELTARTHHTGVIRKRLMPLKFVTELPQLNDPHAVEILNESGQSIGKLRGYCNGYGLALLRIEQAINAKKLLANGIECQTYRPFWWPNVDTGKQYVR